MRTPGEVVQFRSRVRAQFSGARFFLSIPRQIARAGACAAKLPLRLTGALAAAGLAGTLVLGAAAQAQVLQPGDLQPDTRQPDSSLSGGAAALPGGILPGPDGLPAVLSPADAERYRRIFAVQEKGRWKEADALIAALDNRLLMGHVLAQRYLHPTAYRSRYKELKAWMDDYADHPQAPRIYKLALKRRPANYRRPQPPITPGKGILSSTKRVSSEYVSPRQRSKATRSRVAKVKRQVRRNVLRQRFTVTEDLLNRKSTQKLLDQVELDQARARVASGWFYYGRPERAYALAAPAAKRSGHAAPMINWTAGLAAWRLGELEAAAEFFEVLGQTDRAAGWNIAAGAYWAARAHLRLQRPERISPLLQRAALYPHTFYGLLARRALGMPIEFDFGSHRMDPQMAALLKNNRVGSRALALMQVGDREAAERELVKAGSWNDPRMSQALLALAQHARMPSLAFRMGTQLARLGDNRATPGALDAALYPIPPWQPESGFQVDRALIYALMRQESGFNTRAKSPDGARGLMQLMPRTASYMARDRRYRGKKGRNELFEPSLNMELGQRYIAYLLRHERVQGDLFRLTTAYNGGPGNLGKWQRHMKAGDDPLLFIEALPSRETRLFIERVLTNLWIYRQRLGQPAPSLERLAGGDWPHYVALDGTRAEVAQHGQN
ncbi:MAG TPA: lytic transglycosylase domain-containing protein [Kiloniellaceae bacterium]|nr:lytic transglycosylase domain-containing protein [Kiloniellaceae bacterium]HIP78272.1 lytic transglycosylase domain-containing protein [Kiloniellaceae bacterium]